MFDLAIVGSGPAGACAAFACARRGLSVLVLEKEAIPRYKTCGGGVVLRARKLLPFDMGPIAERELCSATLRLLQAGLSFQVVRPEPLVTMTMRSAFDSFLVSQAERAGAQIRSRVKVLALARGPSSVDLRTDSGLVSARFVIGADGVHSTVARTAGWPDHRALAPALESEMRVPDDDLARFRDSAWFDFDIPGRGYAWVFPKREHLSVGVLTLRRRDRDLRQALQQYRCAVGLTRVLHEQQHGYFIPLSIRAAHLARDRVLLAGDAAGLADPITAEGISYAIASGFMAAEALTTAQLEPAKVEARYHQLVRERLYPELRAAQWLSLALYRSPRLRSWLFRRYGPRLVEAMAGVLSGEATYSRLVRDWRNYVKLLRPRVSPVQR